MKYDESNSYDVPLLYDIIEDMAVHICYLESILDMYDIKYDKYCF